MQRVTITRAAEVRQTAGERQPAGIIDRQAGAIADVEHRHREAAVKIECRNVIESHSGHRQRFAHRQHRRRVVAQIGAVKQGLVDEIGVPVEVDPPVLGHTQALGCGGRHQHHSGALIDLIAGHQQTRVRVTDHPVVGVYVHNLGDGAFHRRRRIRIRGSHCGERREQLGHRTAVIRRAQAHPVAAGVFQQPVLGRRPDQTMRDGVLAEQALVAVAAIGELTLDGLAVVGFVTTGVGAVGERPQRRTVLRSEHHHDVGLARGDRAGELGDHMLRTLSPNRFQHRAGRCCPHPSGHRSRIVIRSAQRCHAPAGDLELPQAHDGVDGTGDRRRISTGVGQCGPRRRRRQFHRGHAPVRRIVDPLSELTDADEYRRARIHRWVRFTAGFTAPSGFPGPNPLWPRASCQP